MGAKDIEDATEGSVSYKHESSIYQKVVGESSSYVVPNKSKCTGFLTRR